MSEPADTLDLWDYRRRVHELYADVRRRGGGQQAWMTWRQARDRIFKHHPQSALDAAQRVAFSALSYFPYDPAWRFEVIVEPADNEAAEMEHSAEGTTRFRRFATVSLPVDGERQHLTVYWLGSYGGGVFLPFRDATNGADTYGGGRYLLDTAKGADLGHAGEKVVLDFNFAYQPSCAYNPIWSCPLAPPENRLTLAVAAGELLHVTY